MSLFPSPAALASTGLPESAITAIQQVLAAHPEVEQAILYGSAPPAWPGSMPISMTCSSPG